MSMDSDQKLITSYLKGDERSLEILIKRYLKPIYSFVFRFVGKSQEADDITQEVFVKAWRSLKKFNLKKSFKTWIFTIAKNTAIDYLKKKKEISFSEFEKETGENFFTKTLIDPSPLPQEILEMADTGQLLKRALEKLSSKYRLILYLRYNDHFTFGEIAETLGESINTIKTRHRRGIAALRKLLKEG